MLKLRTVVLCAVMLVFGVAFLASGQDTVDEITVPLGTITLEPPESIEGKKTPVDFPHSKHFMSNCTACHHTWEYDTEILSCTTADCHDQVNAPQKKKSGDSDKLTAMLYYKNAFHKRCIGCHQDIKKKNKAEEKKPRYSDKKTQIAKSGPVSCAGCHPKEQ